VEQLGAEHVLFGSDYPIQESFLERAVRLFEAAEFDAPVRQRVGWENARRLFGLG
jgi:predicted TIM-barrel fold metal-dependent hydrolase